MPHMRSRVVATWTILELAIIGLGLLVALSTYLHYETAQCGGLGALGPIETLLLLFVLALPLALILPIAIVITAVKERQWAWVAALVLSFAASVALVLTGAADVPAQRLIVAVLGAACGNYGAFIVDFLAYALVTLTCLAYAVAPLSGA